MRFTGGLLDSGGRWPTAHRPRAPTSGAHICARRSWHGWGEWNPSEGGLSEVGVLPLHDIAPSVVDHGAVLAEHAPTGDETDQGQRSSYRAGDHEDDTDGV